MRVAINGFGRIGRMVFRLGWNRPDIEFVHINDLTSPDMLALLLHRDSVHGTWGTDIQAVEGGLSIDGTTVRVTAERDPTKLPWKELGVDVVMECTGVFRTKEAASKHLEAGAKRVVISAPGKGVDATFVYGVNHTDYDPARHTVVSNASCTTNCLAPLAKVLHDTVGIEHGMMTTVHSYTMDQCLLDAPHSDFRRARAAAVNMVPTSTGAAVAIGLVLPELKGKLDGMAMRVPTPDGSIVDLTIRTQRDTTVDELKKAFVEAAAGPLKGVLAAVDAPLVSTDILGDPHSSIVDLDTIQVIDGRMVKVLSWYDNEAGFSNRMLDLTAHIGSAG